MNGNTHLFIPGPTNVPEEVRRAMNLPMEDMRAPDFGDFILPLLAVLSCGGYLWYATTRPRRSSDGKAPRMTAVRPPAQLEAKQADNFE